MSQFAWLEAAKNRLRFRYCAEAAEWTTKPWRVEDMAVERCQDCGALLCAACASEYSNGHPCRT